MRKAPITANWIVGILVLIMCLYPTWYWFTHDQLTQMQVLKEAGWIFLPAFILSYITWVINERIEP